MNFWWKRVDGWISGFSENGEFLKLKKPVSSHFSFIGLYWYIEICTYLMHTFWWISAHTCTCETISAIRVMSISITSLKPVSFSFFSFSWWCWWNSASVHWCWTEMQRVLGSGKEWLCGFARQRGRLMPSRLCVSPGGGSEESMKFKEQGAVNLWTLFWLVGGEVIRSQHHQPFAGVYMLVGSMQATSPTWWGFQYLKNSSKDMAQNVICSPW